jgi:hypothetical protein
MVGVEVEARLCVEDLHSVTHRSLHQRDHNGPKRRRLRAISRANQPFSARSTLQSGLVPRPTLLLQILSQLPGLEDRLDSADEGRDLCSELGVGFSRLEEVQELLADQVFEGVLSAEFSFDLASRFALLDPDFAKQKIIDPAFDIDRAYKTLQKLFRPVLEVKAEP